MSKREREARERLDEALNEYAAIPAEGSYADWKRALRHLLRVTREEARRA